MKKNLNQWAKNFLLAEIEEPDNGMIVRILERSYGPWHKEIWVKIKYPSGRWGNTMNFYSPLDIQNYVDGLRAFNQLPQEDKDRSDRSIGRNNPEISLEQFWPGSSAKQFSVNNLLMKSNNYQKVPATSKETIESFCQALENVAGSAPGVANPDVVQL